MIKINLLPVRETKRKMALIQLGAFYTAMVGITIALLMAWHVAVVAKLSMENKKLADLEQQKKALEPELKKVDEFKQKKESVQQRLDVITQLENSRKGPVRIMDELSNATPERLWIETLETSGGRIKLEGQSLDNEVIAAFIGNLDKSEYFSGVDLKESSTTKSAEGLRLNKFKIEAAIVSPNAKAAATEGGAEKSAAGGAAKGKKGKKGKAGGAKPKAAAGGE